MPKTTAAALVKKLEAFDWAAWDKSLAEGITQPYRDVVLTSADAAARLAGKTFNPKDPLLSRFMTNYVGERVVQLNGTTKELVADAIRSKLADATDDVLTDTIRDLVREKFAGYEQYRATRIARSETAIAYNHGNVLGFAQAGVDEVEVSDGTDDDLCANANGQTWSLSDALSEPIAHPNCTRSFIPIVPADDEARQAVEHFELDDLAFICAIASEMITARDDPHADRVLDAIED